MSKDNHLPNKFDVGEYLSCNPDLLNHFCDIEGLKKHFLESGHSEGRLYDLAKKPQSRWDYKNVWDKASSNFGNAKIGVAGFTDDDLFEKSATDSVEYICRNLNITEQCSVLEIGCGVGRVGKVLSKICSLWTGVDASSKMIEYAGKYLKGIDNVCLLESSGYDLSEVASSSVDKVYCIVVFMHLDEWERYNYIKESFRVLKDGGELLVNNINICSKEGWKLFLEHCTIEPKDRPLNISKTSTSTEIENYFDKVGFSDIITTKDDTSLWLTVCGKK